MLNPEKLAIGSGINSTRLSFGKRELEVVSVSVSVLSLVLS